MALNLNDLLKKAERKGIHQKSVSLPSPKPLLRPWQEESILYGIDTNKPEQNLSQTQVKLEPNLSQTEAKLESSPIKLRTKVKPQLSQTQVKLEPNLSQTEAKLEPKTHFLSLIGLQRKIVLFIYEVCQIVLEQQTNPLSIESISAQCQSPKSAVRKAIQRLEYKGIVIRAAFKNGRGGWTQYKLSEQIYQEILILKNKKSEPNLSQTWAKLGPNLSQSEDKLRTELKPEIEPTSPSSSSLNKVITTTKQELGEEWNFDLLPYARLGISLSHIKQLSLLNTLSAVEVEQSLIEFNYDFENHTLPSIKTNKLNFLMGLLRGGQCYVSEGYRNEMQSACLEMAKRAENKRKKLLEEKFLSWEANLTDEERKKAESALPAHLLVLYRAYGLNHKQIWDWMLNYFISNQNEH